MYRKTLLAMTIAGLLVGMPILGGHAWAAPPATHRSVARLPLDAGSIKNLQARLSEKGFSPGQVDGLWGPDTAGALSRFQAANGLMASGRFDRATLAALGPIGAGPLPRAAQPLDAPTASGVPAVTSAAPAPAADTAVATSPTPDASQAGQPGVLIGGEPGNDGADGRTMASAATMSLRPEQGANSFSKGEARRRMVRHGFQHVTDLRTDDMGIWRGAATHYSQRVRVWLDYKGNVGLR